MSVRWLSNRVNRPALKMLECFSIKGIPDDEFDSVTRYMTQLWRAWRRTVIRKVKFLYAELNSLAESYFQNTCRPFE